MENKIVLERLSKIANGWLDLRNCKLDALPIEIMPYISKIEWLDLRNNNISQLTDFLLTMPKLKCVLIKNNPIAHIDNKYYSILVPSGKQIVDLAIASEACAGVDLDSSSKKELDIMEQATPNWLYLALEGDYDYRGSGSTGRLKSIPEIVSILPNLRVLKLNYNNISSLAGLADLPQLQSLDVYGNKLSSLEGLIHVPQLQELSVWNNELSSLEGLIHVPQLQSLYVNYNELSSLEGLVDLPQLQSLNVSSNKLSSLEGLIHVPQLQSLNVSSNKLSSLEGLIHVPQLQSLNVSSNKLSSLEGLIHVPQLQELSVWNNELSSLEGLIHVPQLQSLNVDDNELSSLEGLIHVPQLQELSVSDNELSSLEGLIHVPQLQSLNVDDNELSSLEGLIHVPQLQELSVSDNELSSLEGLIHVPQLQSLNVSSNKLSSLEGLIHVPQLQSLYVNDNELSSLEGLVDLPQLQELSVSDNELSSLEGLIHVPQLQSLYVNDNELRSLEGLVDLPQLQSLYVNSNKLSSLEGLIHVPQLQSLYVNDNELSSLKRHLLPSNIITIEIKDNPLTHIDKDVFFIESLTQIDADSVIIENLPKQIFDRGIESIRQYYLDLDKEGAIIPKRLRVLLLGNTDAGKTALKTRYIDRNTDIKSLESTYGIERTLKTVEVNSSDITLDIWDFGGQEIFHATHQLFYGNNVLYLLLINPLQEDKLSIERTLKNFIKEELLFPTCYWLETIQNFGSGAILPVFSHSKDASLINKLPQFSKEDEAWITSNNSAVLKVSPALLLDSGNDYAYLYKELDAKINTLLREAPLRNTLFCKIPKIWMRVLEDVQKSLKLTIEEEEYTEILRNHICSLEEPLVCLQYWHDLGEILYYPNNPILQKKIFVNAKTICDEIYNILDVELYNSQGAFSQNDVRARLSKDYKHLTEEFIALMLELQIIFVSHNSITKQSTYYAPQYLESFEEAEVETLLDKNFSSKIADSTTVLGLHYDYFVPRDIIVKVLTTLGNQQYTQSIYWRDGIVFLIRNVRFILRLERYGKGKGESITFGVFPNSTVEDLPNILYEVMQLLNNTLPKLDNKHVHYYLHCSSCKCSSTRFAIKDLLENNNWNNGDCILQCLDCKQVIDMAKLANNIDIIGKWLFEDIDNKNGFMYYRSELSALQHNISKYKDKQKRLQKDNNKFKICLLSPSDVAHEREVITKLIEEIIEEDTYKRKLELMKWEDIYSIGKVEQGQNLQLLIEEALEIKDCDLAIILFGKTIGTEQEIKGNSTTGTVHELNLVLNDSKEGLHPLVCFKEVNAIDFTDEEFRRYAEVLNIKNKISNTTLWKKFKNDTELKELIEKKLDNMLKKGTGASNKTVPDNTENFNS